MRGTADALIVGGGPAGATAAALLAEAGRRVVLFERSRGPHHKVCGEFLSGEAAGLLDRLGLDPAGLGAVPVGRVRLVAGRREAAADLPFPAWGLSRETLDEALLDAAAARGASIRRGAAVRRLETGPGGAVAHAGACRVAAASALLATGKHDLRGHARPPGRVNDLIGFKQHWRPGARALRALDGHVEIYLFPGGYAGLQMVPDGRANLCLVVRRATYDRVGRTWPALLERIAAACPAFAERLDGGEPCWPRPLSIFGIPYGFVHRGDGSGMGTAHRVGDQLAVIPSFCGDGMAIAMDSARRAAERILTGTAPGDGAPYARQIATAHAAGRIVGDPFAAAWAVAAANLAPGLLTWFARCTRVAGSALAGRGDPA